MSNWYSIFPKNPLLSISAWIFFCFVPLYFVFRTTSTLIISIAVAVLVVYIICFRFSYSTNNGLVYMCLALEMVINAVMTVLFGYIYFAFFTAFFIGNIRHTIGFYIMYGLHIAMTVGSIIGGFFIETELFIKEIPFIVIVIFGVILGPFYLYSANKRDKLQGQLATANERISELSVYEERQRIARDLHDTLGQKLSMVGLKSDLAIRLVKKDQDAAIEELRDIRQTASIALKEVREMVSNMKAVKLQDELLHVQQILTAANIKMTIESNSEFHQIPTIIGNTLSMCLKEVINNVVRHSKATECTITIIQKADVIQLTVLDNGIGISSMKIKPSSNGLNGMKERVEFVNGELEISEQNGTLVKIIVPNVIMYQKEDSRRD
ncbi:sensor histidine kinase [Viridibacillus sp. YIM B01967]|uniref:histidine kinase n=1 Tax=Viridibacillus soli TaxID=2798301 RepID=A0ABS1HD23_9BACL|nr:sensor histidine kinase [Viridibacillus soli]